MYHSKYRADKDMIYIHMYIFHFVEWGGCVLKLLLARSLDHSTMSPETGWVTVQLMGFNSYGFTTKKCKHHLTKRLVHHCFPPKDTRRMKGTKCYCYSE